MYGIFGKKYMTYDGSVIHVIIDDDDKIWFNVKDALIALGYKDYKNAFKRIVDKRYVIYEQDMNYKEKTRHSRVLYISESGLYRLMTRSRLPKAIKFTNWIYDQLLPNIRKYGKYQLT